MFECFTSNLRAMRRWLVGRSGAALLEGAAPAAPRYPQRHGEGDYLADSGAAGAVRPKRRDSGKAWLCLCAVLLPSLAPAQLNTPVLPQPSIDPVAAGKTDTLLRLPDGKILVGSNTLQGFDRLGTASVADCARLAIDGSVDLSFQCAAGPVVEFATDSVGRIYVRTNFTVKRLLATGAIDPAFPTVSSDLSIVQMLIVDDQIYLSGVFTLINGQPRAHLARLNLSGTVDPGFNPQVDGSVFAMLAPGDSFLYVGGNFQTLAGQPRTRIGRLLLPGGTLDSWTVSLTRSAGTPQVQTLAIDATHVYIGGIFDAVQGQSRSGLARVSRQASAALDTAWTARLIGEGVSTGLSLLTVVGEHLYLAIGFSRISLQSGTVSDAPKFL